MPFAEQGHAEQGHDVQHRAFSVMVRRHGCLAIKLKVSRRCLLARRRARAIRRCAEGRRAIATTTGTSAG